MRSLTITLAVAGVGLSPMAIAENLPHRDDFAMNFISGDEFRAYVSDQATEEDDWADSMRTFGELHNEVHEMMTALARYDRDVMDGSDRAPSFDNRISGGQWTEYVQQVQSLGGSWRDTVQVVEIMHDRLHHAMYKAVLHDAEAHDRFEALEERLPSGEPEFYDDTIPEPGARATPSMGPQTFLDFVAEASFDSDAWAEAMASMADVNERLYDVLTAWADASLDVDDDACHAPEHTGRMTEGLFNIWRANIEECGERGWVELVEIAALMHDGMMHTNHKLVAHHNDPSAEAMR